LVIVIDNGGAETWHIQLNKYNVKLEAGKKYKISFKAKAEKARSMSAYTGMSVSPWSAYSGYSSINLADTFQVYSIVFDMKTNDNAARMTFDMGKSASDVTITDIKLETLVFVPPLLARVQPAGKPEVYPNPFKDKLNVVCEGYSKIQIFNLSGQVVFQKTVTENIVSADMTDLFSGTFILKMTGDGKTFSEKLIKH
jgi:hypothetical protein